VKSVETRGRTLEEMSRLFGIEGRLAERSGFEYDSTAKAVTNDHVEEVVDRL
jgi:hypothetical protein